MSANLALVFILIGSAIGGLGHVRWRRTRIVRGRTVHVEVDEELGDYRETIRLDDQSYSFNRTPVKPRLGQEHEFTSDAEGKLIPFRGYTYEVWGVPIIFYVVAGIIIMARLVN